MKKEAKVHMLPTNGKDIAMLSKRVKDGMLQSANGPEGVANCNTMWQPQHLYILSDEELKKGDWFIWLKYNFIEKATKKDNNKDCRKIIATTDPKLTKPSKVTYGNMEMINTNGDGSYYHYKGETEFSLSREELISRNILIREIPQSFIEEYCKAGGIDRVMVECENSKFIVDKSKRDNIENGFNKQIKTDSNNCIIIHPVKEKMYSKEEIIKMFWDCHGGVLHQDQIK